MPSSTLEEYAIKKFDCLKKKSYIKELEMEITLKQNEIQEIDEKLNSISPSSTDASAEKQKNELIPKKSDLSQKLNDLNSKKQTEMISLDIINKDLFAMQLKLNKSKVTSSDSYITSQDDIFKVDTRKFTLVGNIVSYNMSDRSIISFFKVFKKDSLDWISACPKWQHLRLMSLYERYLENDNENIYSNESVTPEAIVSKSNCGFYQYIKDSKKQYFKPLAPLESNTTVTIINSTDSNFPTVVTHDKEHYIYIEYSKGQYNKVRGYVKKKNIVFKGATIDAFSTAQSAQNLASDVSTASTKFGLFDIFKRNKHKSGVTDKDSETTGEDKFHLNNVSADYPNPALLNDKQIYDQFRQLKEANKDCQGWIDAFLVHNSRMTRIYNMFANDYSKFVTIDGKTTMSSENYDSLDESGRPDTLLALITEKNAYVYIEGEGGSLDRVANLNKGDYVKVNVNPDSSSQKLSHKNKVWNSKEYTPITCLSEGKILFGYVNSDHISFLTTNDESIIKKSDDTQTITTSDAAKDELGIKVLEDTLKQQDLPTNIPRPLEPNMAKNPLLMSDAQIHENINELNDPDKVYQWASSFPLQKRRIKEIYDKGNEMAGKVQVNGRSASIEYKFDKNKPKTLMATVIKDSAHVYPAAGDNIALQPGSSTIGGTQKIKACGELQKGAKVRLSIKDESSPSDNSPLFIYHKDTAGNNTRYLKIQYLDTDYLYKDGFISVNAISTYTLEQEVEGLVSSMLDRDFDNSYQDYSLGSNMSLEDIVGGINDTLVTPIGDESKSFGVQHNSDDSIKLDKDGNVMFKHLLPDDIHKESTSIINAASSLPNIVFSIKAYAEKFNIQKVFNEELMAVLSSTATSTSGIFGAAASFLSPESASSEGLKISDGTLKGLANGFSIIKRAQKDIPFYWKYFKNEEEPDSQLYQAMFDDYQDFLNEVSSTLNILSSFNVATLILPPLSALISVLSSLVKLLLDIQKFAKDEMQVRKMYNKKLELKATSNTAEYQNKEQRQKYLNTLNTKIDYFQFKGKNRTKDDNTTLQYLLKERAEYNDLFITTELENVNKKRRNRRITAISADILNLSGDVLGAVSTLVPSPEVILSANLSKLAAKAAASALSTFTSAVRHFKQWHADRDKNNPNNTRNKQIRYSSMAIGIIKNILCLPIKYREHLYTNRQEAAIDSRYNLVEAHINASGAKLMDLEKCNGDVSKMFKILYAAIIKRE